PSWPGMEEFKGSWIHPQSWPKNPEIADKEVVVIGSGATTATLVPNIADECSHITILQRSPTYFFQSPNADPLADQLRGLDTPEEWIHDIIRRKSMADMQSMTQIQMLHPDLSKAGLVQMVAAQLPEGYDVETHFTPRHLPHEQRICRILDGDLFKKISEGRVSMVTDEIECFTADGITTKGGEHLKADLVITATGFNLTVLGDVAFYVDGEAVDFANSFTYRGIMFTGVPNMAWTFGALRVSWTMRADLVSQFLCRLLKEMEATQASSVVAKLRSQDASMEIGPFIDPAQFNPGYAQRSRDLMPRSGSKPEWQLSLDYWAERDVLPTADLHDGCLIFNASN
ncbi:MAG: NAD(P)/FAD-dependent oxidoreductase, partial [Actinobacteria bacterium]|nr:NAD(P)/FAD-dependent oxidoreductase [Actinomycetota bacterium]